VTASRLRSYTSERPDLHPLLPPVARRVLDVGCSNGAVAAALKRRFGATVVGIEIDPAFAREAAQRLDRVICIDALGGLAELAGERFDCAICADVLEHLVDPEAALRALHALLVPGATVVVSLPNVRFYDTFVQLGFHGRWPERDRGVHDRTHLRWFTDGNARALFDRTGFRVTRATANYRLRDAPDAPVNRFAERLARGPLQPFLAYQLLYALVPVEETPAPRERASR
jgi:2-polyprenyl-3-methyl-5-hydroxy-6-metoxy-1,4-benzoquinol methylase